MGYERIQKPEGRLYHYTRKENLESILRDGRIRKFCDRETWFTKSLADTLRLMSLTVMQEGAAYYDASGRLQRYPAFVPEDYVVLELTPRYQSGEWVIWNQELPPNAPESVKELAEEFSHLKLGYRGDLKFWENPVIYEMTKKKWMMMAVMVLALTMMFGTTVYASGKGDVAGAIEGTWQDASAQIKTVVNKVVFPAIDLILAVFFFAKLGTAYFDYRKHGQFEWAAPAILFACLVFTLTAPTYIWKILGI